MQERGYGSARLAMLCAVSAGALVAALGAPSQAQEDDEASTSERIVVTGSRIQRRDYEANSPIVTVDAEAFESQTSLNVEAYLNQLPQFNPAASPVTTDQDVQITAVNSVGVATVSLRGLGANRNLVLVDGRRPTPVNALGVTDTNAIPSALISRVEVITGGASAVYGADAVGGVVNFILKDNFEGLELDAQYGMTEAGDGEEFRISGVMGFNSADGRGNVTMGAEHYSRSAAYEANRDFHTDAWADPYTGGDFFAYGYQGYQTALNPPATSTVNALFADRETGDIYSYGSFGFFNELRFNDDGTVWSQGNGLYRFTGTVDNYEYALQTTLDGSTADPTDTTQSLKWNNVDQYVSAPQTRYSLFASGHYDITESLEFFARGSFAESVTKTRLFPSPAIYGWEASIPYNPTTDSPVDPSLNYQDASVVAAVLANPTAYANPSYIASGLDGAQHPVTTELAVLLNSRGNSSAPWIFQYYPLDSYEDRQTTNTNNVWQIEAGLRGDVAFRDWTWEAYVSHGQASTYNVADGNYSLERYRALITQPDYGRGAVLEGNEDGASVGFGAARVTCESGFYDTIFNGDQPLSDDCKYAISATLQTRTQTQQNIAELNLEGGLFELPAGEVRAAAGYQYRENNAQFYPDILQSTASFEDQVIGVYPTAYMDASTDAQDVYTELLVPIVAGLPGVQQFDLELGARYSYYSASDAEWTYKALADWTLNDWLRLRGGYNRATRAPNLGELYLSQQEIFTIGGANFGDPCALRSTAPYGAAGVAEDPVLTAGEASALGDYANGQTAEGANSAYLICQAQMDAAGANYFYNVANAGGTSGSSFNWIYQEGNSDLESEKADTWTFGAVVRSPFDNPWLSGLTASVDWYQLEITDAIQQYSVDYARFLCYGTVTVATVAEAEAQAETEACQNVGRVAGTGGADSILVAYDNLATIETSGVDVALNWMSELTDLGADVPGGIGVNVQLSMLDYYRTKASPEDFDVWIDWKGSLGPTLSGTNAGAYDYRVFTSFNYFVGPANLSLRWRHLPEVWSASYASTLAIIENNEGVVAGGDGIILSYTPPTDIKAEDYDVFDLSGSWQITDMVSVRAGVDNLFDTEPVTTAATAGRPPGTDLTSVCNGYVEGCVNPTSYSLPNNAADTTNSGYYDSLGRRFFVGLKLTY